MANGVDLSPLQEDMLAPKRWTPTEHDIATVARVCHEANRAVCICNGDLSQPDWDSAPDWQRESIIEGVTFNLTTNYGRAEHSHNRWMKKKLEDGWRYGPVKDSAKKEHPCLLPREFLPDSDRVKDDIFVGICAGYRKAMIERKLA